MDTNDNLDFGKTLVGMAPGQKVFGRFTVKKLLGRGGMGIVWLARDDKLERDVALKFLPETVVHDARAVADLKRETRRSLELTHPHIVRIHDFLDDAQTAGISMEFVAGDTLARLSLERPGQHFETADLRGWVTQLCAALDYAHDKVRIVHRDLKPANLMIDAAGDLKVADFGIASTVADSVSRVSKQAGSSGTPPYMSPQQLMGDKPAVTDDIYSMGATLYDLLTGKPPFYSGRIESQVLNKVPPVMAERRQELEVTGAFIPPEWEATIAACLAKEPKDRPQSAAEVAERLGLASSPNVQRSPSNAGRPSSSPAVKRPDPRTLSGTQANALGATGSTSKAPLFAGLATVVVLLAGLAYYFGVYAPEQKRLAEMARLEAQGRAAEAAQLRNAQEKAAAETKAQAERERLAAERLAAARGGLVIRTTPSGVEVRVGAIALEKSPLTLKELKLGKYPVRVRAEGYEEWTGEAEVKENDFADLDVALVRSTGIVALSSDPAGLEAEVVGRTVPNTPPPAARQSIRTPASLRLPTGSYDIIVRRPGWLEQKQTIEVARNQSSAVAADFASGGLELTSIPAGAEVWQGGKRVGTTPYRVSEAIPGRYDFDLKLKDYKTAAAGLTVSARQTAHESVELEEQPFPQPGQTWVNTIGQRFVPVPGTHVLFSIWETRVQDFAAFVEATGYDATQSMYSDRGDGRKLQGDSWKSPGFGQGGTQPVIGMSEPDARAFCSWLTQKERREGRLGPDQEYRLPTDAEWDAAVGKDEFPWGNGWPPPRGAGNYADQAAKRGRYKTWDLSAMPGYEDGYDSTAPVGSFSPNQYGIYDLGGNAWERVGDRNLGLRGGSFCTVMRDYQTSVTRITHEIRDHDVGFRVVCAVGAGR